MERQRSQDKVFFTPARCHSSSDKLPEISSTHSVVLAKQSETATEYRLPPIIRQDGGCQRRENTNQIGEKLKYRRSGGCIDDRRTTSVTDVEVPNPRETMGQGLKRSDVGSVWSGQKTELMPLPPTSLDAKRIRDRKTAFQRRNSSLSHPANENVIIEEIYLLPRRKSTNTMTQTSRRHWICGLHPPLRNTRSDESHKLREIRSCGKILSRCIYHSDRSVSDSSYLLFGIEEINTRGAMTTEVRAAPLRNSAPFLYREDKSGAQTEQKVHLEGENECGQLGKTGKQQQQGPFQLHQENMSESFSRAEASNQDRFSASYHQSPGIVHGKSVVAEDLNGAKDNEKEHIACCVTGGTKRTH